MNKKVFKKIALQYGIELRYAGALNCMVYNNEKGNDYSKIPLTLIKQIKKTALEEVKTKEGFFALLTVWEAFFPIKNKTN